MPSTIGQVALRAGVSKATVSRVLNDSKPVNEETRLRVMQAIEELEFTPNPAARSLVYKKSKIIGVIVTDISNLFVSVLVRGIEEIAYSKGYSILICNSYKSTSKELELLNMLKSKRVDGIIFLTSNLRPEHKKIIKSSSEPFALVNAGCDKLGAISVSIDNFKAAYDMTSYFLDKGYTKVGMIYTYFEDKYSGEERYQGYRQALKDYNIEFDERLVAVGDLEADDGYMVVRAMLGSKIRLQALFVACDLMAFGVIRALRECGLSVPEDVEVAGFDDVPMATYFQPALTTVHQPIDRMGRLVAEELIKMVEGADVEKMEIVLPHKIICRESTAKLKESPDELQKK
jgi:LacI family transcriptional regulator